MVYKSFFWQVCVWADGAHSPPVLSAYVISRRFSEHPWPAASQHMVPRMVDPADKTKEKSNTGLGKEED